MHPHALEKTEEADGEKSDHVGDKPWIDGAKNAQWLFWDAANEWLPTWGKAADRGMTVRSVRMWQQGVCGQTQEL